MTTRHTYGILAIARQHPHLFARLTTHQETRMPTLTPDTLREQLFARKQAIEAAWRASGAHPGSMLYTVWMVAYGQACKRYYRAMVFLPYGQQAPLASSGWFDPCTNDRSAS